VAASDFANYQNEIYFAGLGGQKPEFPIAYESLQATAKESLSPEAYGYVAGGAGSEDTMRANVEAFRNWRLVPRMLRDVETRDLSITLLGSELPAPVMLAPIGVQEIIHPDKEIATARAAASIGIPIILSTAGSTPMEDVATAMGEVPRWYQLYWPRDPELAASFMKRAESAGYSAIVVTLDTTTLAWRPRDLQHGFLPFLSQKGVAQYLSDPVFLGGLEKSVEEDPTSAVLHWVQNFSNPAYTWEDLAYLRDNTSLPLVLKGVLHPDDARKAVDAGMAGVIVSNHGGRQVDGEIATLDALPAIVAEVGSEIPVLLDSGIRTGADAVKALALGATAVLLGRPYAWGLAVGGEAGVRQVVKGFLAELDLTMALTGLRSIGEIDRSCLVHTRDL
jgi:isopentenyl diphosphate isomerase/L-lactate dehydrogenase-like FMN-dependent dehydrogenase